jgi:hypothetical protein
LSVAWPIPNFSEVDIGVSLEMDSGSSAEADTVIAN